MSRLPLGIAVLGTALALTLAGCSTPTDNPTADPGPTTVSVDVGLDAPVEVTPPARLALFASTDYNDFSTLGHQAADAAAAEAGVTLDYFAADVPDVQLQQLQNAIQTGEYNGFIVQPKGPQVCEALTKEAPAAGILVAAFGNSVCGDDPLTAQEASLPGLLTWVGGTQLAGGWQELAEHALDENPDATSLVSFGGFPALTFSVAQVTGTEAALEGSRVENLGVIDTDYSTADALTKAQTYFLANPDTSIVISLASSITEGLVQAIDEAGLSGIAIYDSGCSSAVLKLIVDGKVRGCLPTSPKSQYATSVKAILAAIDGKAVPRFYENDGTENSPTYVNKDNAGGFEAPF